MTTSEHFKGFITDSLRKYDIQTDKLNNLLKKAVYFTVKPPKSNFKRNIFVFFDENKKQIGHGEAEILGAYNTIANIWSWGWSWAGVSDDWRQVVNQLAMYGLSLGKSNEQLKHELLQTRFYSYDFTQIDIYLAMSLSLTKVEYIYKLALNPNDPHNSSISDGHITKLHKTKTPYDNDIIYQYFFMFNFSTEEISIP